MHVPFILSVFAVFLTGSCQVTPESTLEGGQVMYQYSKPKELTRSLFDYVSLSKSIGRDTEDFIF